MATYDLATLVASIKKGETSIDVLSDHRDIAQNMATRIELRLIELKRRRDSFQAKVDRADAHIANPDVTYYETDSTFMDRKATNEQQVTILNDHIANDTANLQPYTDELAAIDAELIPLRQGIFD